MEKIIIACMCFFLVLTVVNFASATDVDGARIVRIGAAPHSANEALNRSGYPIFLRHSSWVGTRLFYLSHDLGNEGLAAALTALSLEKSVWARILSDTNEKGSIITILYVNEQ